MPALAGQHATLLNVDGAGGAIDTVKTVWRSGQSDAAMAYPSSASARTWMYAIAVVIQKPVVADIHPSSR
jgi:phosphoenolpyruvate synthase/pyruvate phosphate dikinase